MQELISLSDAAVQVAVPPRQRSAGLAWLLSVVLPGAGHVYLGLYLRGGLVFGFSLIGLIALVSAMAGGGQASSGLSYALVGQLPVLWVFGFVDAYMTAGESNRGIEPKSVDNPRVAAVLNLTTRGFGYFYLGEREKGIALFVILSIVQLSGAVVTGRLAALVTVAALAVTIWISIDAYRLGRRAFDSQVASMELPPPPQTSMLPVAVPLAFAGLIAFVYVALIVTGLVILLLRPPVAS